MKFVPYEQTTSQSCLVVCLFLLANLKISQKKELDLLLQGWRLDKVNHVASIAQVFATKYKKKVRLYVHYKYYSKILKELYKKRGISVFHLKIGEKALINHLPCALYLDYYQIIAPVHGPHFVLLEDLKNGRFSVIDPWTGKRKLIKKDLILKAVNSLKNHLKFSPIIVVLK